jgi:hypothetical protein
MAIRNWPLRALAIPPRQVGKLRTLPTIRVDCGTLARFK